ncbi:hypothetical protein D1B31_13790 [Neobacillus notoginsengisoli]|uniref:Cysteine-rich CWC family protein n=1 Tax=Neobacillus notoginsengisoli TaxID=1578198 RepID=A0A417YSU5_9BACI|nr:cysteine-rich CWC family protein [Neobacillus notoginsengisoli]RHW39030.1 hypothetical protein D1B31_13790 [Neobacillus notoginsengisoli]
MSAKICPLCGEKNGCMSEKTGTCWCTAEEFPKGIFETVPAESLYKDCICKKCLDQYIKEAGTGSV